MRSADLPFSLFLALRYLKPKRTFLSVITLISVLGVMLGVMILILVTSVMSGFELEIRSAILKFEAHMVATNGRVMHDWRPIADTIREHPGVVAAAPFIQGPVILQGPQQPEGGARRLAPKVRGVDPDEELKVIDIRTFVEEVGQGEYNLEGDYTILGSALASYIGANVGDFVTVYSPGNLDAVFDELERIEADQSDDEAVGRLKELVLPAELEVTGIFETGRLVYDSEFFVVPLHIGQELYGVGDGVHGITIMTENPFLVDVIRAELYEKLPEDIHMPTWIEMNRDKFESIRLERSLTSFLLFFIVIVAAFGIMSTLITVTVLKTREIGVLKALGATQLQVIGIFLLQGVVVGFFGTLAGLGLGMWLVNYRNQVRDWLSTVLNIQVFPQTVYEFAQIPARVIPQDVVTICVMAFVICTLAALIPAWVAARLEPVKALRYE